MCTQRPWHLKIRSWFCRSEVRQESPAFLEKTKAPRWCPCCRSVDPEHSICCLWTSCAFTSRISRLRENMLRASCGWFTLREGLQLTPDPLFLLSKREMWPQQEAGTIVQEEKHVSEESPEISAQVSFRLEFWKQNTIYFTLKARQEW